MTLAGRWAQLLTAFVLFAGAAALMIQSQLGLGPWDTLHFGMHLLTGLPIGTISILVGLLILGISLLLGVRPGLGTLANMVLIGLLLDLLLPYVPEPEHALTRFTYFAAGILIAGFGTGMYIGADLGRGPRDGLITALALRSGRSFRLVRTLLELTVLALAWPLGGRIGIGTVLFALTIGPASQWGLRLFGLDPAGTRPTTMNRVAAEPTLDAAA